MDTSVAHPARRYNYWLGGKDHFAADRESGDLLAAKFPSGRTDARARSAAEFGRFFAGLELVEPGIVAVSDWHPDRPADEQPCPADVAINGAVGRLP
jgi:hypothetical protein